MPVSKRVLRERLRDKLEGRVGTYMRGELGAVELTLWDKGGVSVRSFMMRMA